MGGGFRQMTVISGKGGTGKTSIVAALAGLFERLVLADCDVDAADLHLVVGHERLEESEFMGLKSAVIDGDKCVECGLCIDNCRFMAIRDYRVDGLLCEGCGVCRLVCPHDAVSLVDKPSGKCFVSKTGFGPMVHARLYPGEEASGKLVTRVREKACLIAGKEGYPLVLIDGSPGIGCPVIASIGGVDLVLVVTEPTVSGVHDLERILSVAGHFGVSAAVVVNKYDINRENTDKIIEYCREKCVPVVGRIPYDLSFTKAQIRGSSVLETGGGQVCESIKAIHGRVRSILFSGD